MTYRSGHAVMIYHDHHPGEGVVGLGILNALGQSGKAWRAESGDYDLF